ncbi:MAG: hypothetical protein HYV28_04750 [Ignavibacteriales bacterium]|nr:hypothetical protein [Ignavibacteriales bacterium]
MRIFFWFLFFFVVYRIYKIIRTATRHNPDEPSIHKTDSYIKQPSYSEHDVIDAEYKEIDKDK